MTKRSLVHDDEYSLNVKKRAAPAAIITGTRTASTVATLYDLSLCPACRSALNCPNTLPCGYTLCKHCMPVKQPCISSTCSRLHTTAISINVTMEGILNVLQKHEDEQKVLVLLAEKLECPICFSLFNTPTTTPCGHTFCKACMVRTLDHGTMCPVCRRGLDGWLPRPTAVLCRLMGIAFQQQQQQDPQETVVDDDRVPILVLPFIAFPHVRCVIQIHEPRYRLMLRRVMESGDHRIGLCLHLGGSRGFYEYGTMLELTQVQTLDDGRSVVHAVGTFRFRVVTHEMLDGYHIGELDRVVDVDREQEEAIEREQIMRACADRARQHATALPPFSSSSSPAGTSSSPLPPRPPQPAMLRHAMAIQRPSWAAQAHPQTARSSPWVQMHLQGLSAAQNKKKPPLQPFTATTTTRPESSSPPEEKTTDELIQQLAIFVRQVRARHEPRLSQWIQPFGDPPDASQQKTMFTWWLTNMIPVGNDERVKLLAMRLLRERVLMLIRWTNRFRDQWSNYLGNVASRNVVPRQAEAGPCCIQ